MLNNEAFRERFTASLFPINPLTRTQYYLAAALSESPQTVQWIKSISKFSIRVKATTLRITSSSAYQ